MAELPTLLGLTDSYPQYWWRDNAAAAHEKNWCLAAQGGDYFLQAVDDLNAASTNVLRVQRTGITIDAIDWIATVMRLNGVSLRDASIIDSGVFPPGRLGTGTPSSSNFLRGDGAWAAVPPGVTDHGALTGLADDDHPQYLTQARGDARYPQLNDSRFGGIAMNATGLGAVGPVGLDNWTDTPAEWSALPIGYARMMNWGIAGGPPDSTYGYFLKVASRDGGGNNGGWGGLWIGYDGNPSYIGQTSLGTSFATWQKIWTDANDGPGSGLDADLFDGMDNVRFVYGDNASASGSAPATWSAADYTQIKSGFWEVQGAGWTPDNNWWWGLTSAHRGNGGSYNYGGQLVFSIGGVEAYWRVISSGSQQPWRRLWHDGNFNPATYVPPSVKPVHALLYMGAPSGTVIITSSYNISSVTDHQAGDFTANFTTASVQQSMLAGFGHRGPATEIHGVCGGAASIGSTSSQFQTRSTGGRVDMDFNTCIWIKNS